MNIQILLNRRGCVIKKDKLLYSSEDDIRTQATSHLLNAAFLYTSATFFFLSAVGKAVLLVLVLADTCQSIKQVFHLPK